ncbi:MAG: alkaline phosphatase [Ignavibacteria bacterium]|nr:alkaline phosphatase [Ignavibacteria bacterium]MBT8381021.1 alkaline phosphatase [Ignavibacteria bacterium]MBT8390523.1 alkaline phosphatase [Ignavibacteria bacterium]NNJ51782.1 alkaline phosphatase [Ignavibacteriaceae bacterium]NNL22790.1 alkaline phosphatase [Ignavibacteriaceae bacterium]
MFKSKQVIFSLSTLIIILMGSCSNKEIKTEYEKGNVIFIHPDGSSLAMWNAVRVLYYRPGGELHWDKLSNIGLYQGYMTNTLTASSEGGATIHAYGVKVKLLSYGMNGNKPLISRSGTKMSIMQEAIQNGIRTGIINSGTIVEPGTGVFVASDNSRANEDAIAKKIIESGADLIFSGGESVLLPEGVNGKFGSGKRKDSLNLVKIAEEMGYYLIYNKEELLSAPINAEKVLGIFASRHTFNDASEEELLEKGLSNYSETAPTIAEMTKFAVRFLSKNNKQFFLVVEEEGTDNFGNANNADGTFEALKRADDAIGEILEFMDDHTETLLLTAADSEAGGLEIYGFLEKDMPRDKPLPEKSKNGAPQDGVNGTGSLPFLTGKDLNGNRFPFAVAWSTSDDVFGSVIAKAEGLNAELMQGKIDNTDIYRIMYATLFGTWIE